MSYEAVLLDMDGTVLNTLEDLTNAVNYSLSRFKIRQVPAETVRANLGNGAARLIQGCMPENSSEELTRRVLEFYMPYYDAHCRIKTRPYDGVVPMMERLNEKSVKLAIISNKPDGAVKELAEAFFPGLLQTAVGESARVRRKPDPDAVLAAAELLGVPVEKCVYAGDSEVDLETARRAGMDCIAVCWGFRSERQLREAGAETIAHDAAELERFIID